MVVVLTSTGMRFRGYRGSRRHSTGIRQVIQSFKKVINFAPASFTTGSSNLFLTSGKDSIAAGQTSALDVDVPTGSVIRYIEIQFSLGNLAAAAAFIHVAIQKTHGSQTAVVANVVGGNPQRNQVFHQALYQVGESQSNSRVFRFKIPKREQRVREGDSWIMNWNTSETVSMSAQVIYKFYR